jgi:hypothetical protein
VPTAVLAQGRSIAAEVSCSETGVFAFTGESILDRVHTALALNQRGGRDIPDQLCHNFSVERRYAGAALECPALDRFRVEIAERGWTRQNGPAMFTARDRHYALNGSHRSPNTSNAYPESRHHELTFCVAIEDQPVRNAGLRSRYNDCETAEKTCLILEEKPL